MRDKLLKDGWTETTLGASGIRLQHGFAFQSKDFLESGTTAVIRIGDLQDGGVSTENSVRINEKINSSQIPSVSHGDLLIALTGGNESNLNTATGRVGVYKHKIPALINQRVAKVIGFEKIDKDFLYYYLRQNNITHHLASTANGSVQRNLTNGHIAGLKLLLPSLPEQRAIAAVLSSIDEKIELLRNQNKTLESIAQQLFREWFVEFNFPNANGEPYKKSGGKMVNGELGEMPEGWRTGKFADEVEIVMGQSPSGSSYNESGDGMIFFQGRAEFSDRFPITRLYTTEPKKIAEQHDVLISVRAPVGDINVASEQCCIGRGLAAVRGKHMSYTLHRAKSLKNEFDKYNAEGTVFGAINKAGMENIAVVIPAEEVVFMFETMVSVLDEKYYKNFLQIQNLTSIREFLLPRMMTGEVRVSDSAIK